MANSKLQEILDQAVKTPNAIDIQNLTSSYVKSFEAKARAEAPDDFSTQMAKELGAMRVHYQNDVALLIGHIIQITTTKL